MVEGEERRDWEGVRGTECSMSHRNYGRFQKNIQDWKADRNSHTSQITISRCGREQKVWVKGSTVRTFKLIYLLISKKRFEFSIYRPKVNSLLFPDVQRKIFSMYLAGLKLFMHISRQYIIQWCSTWRFPYQLQEAGEIAGWITQVNCWFPRCHCLKFPKKLEYNLVPNWLIPLQASVFYKMMGFDISVHVCVCMHIVQWWYDNKWIYIKSASARSVCKVVQAPYLIWPWDQRM